MSIALLRSADGRRHYVAANGTSVAAAATDAETATFAIETFELEPHGGCCGPSAPLRGQAAEAFWEEHAHKRILERAAERMQGAAVRDLPNVRVFNEVFWASPEFRDATFRGLKGADLYSPWTDPTMGSWGVYGYHFCDPATLRTMPWLLRVLPQWDPFSALTECQRYFDLAAHDARRVLRLGRQAPASLLRSAGHALGLSLHFLTDLTQPMHAANFGNVIGDDEFPNPLDYRHSQFEIYADKKVDEVLRNLPELTREFLDEPNLLRWRHAAAIAHDVATASKKVWSEILGPLARSKPRTNDPWGSEADPAVKASLEPAPSRVAHFLTYWARAARQDPEVTHGLARGRWYNLLEPTRGVHLADGGGGWITTHPPNGGDPQRLFVLFHADGTATLGSKDAPGKTWQFALWFGLHYLAADTDSGSPAARFRLAPAEQLMGLYSQTRIQENGSQPEGDQVITIVDGPGWVLRAQPELGAMRPARRQSFRLRDAGAMTDEDKRMLVRHRGAGALEMPWWGVADGEPRWRDWEPVDYAMQHAPAGMAAASRGSGLLDVFAVVDGQLWQREWLGVWGPWTPLGAPHGVRLTGAIAAASWSHTRLDVSAMGGDRRLHHAYWTGETGRWRWWTFDPELKEATIHLAACAPAPQRLDLFGTFDGTLRRMAWDGAKWSEWQDVPASRGARIGFESPVGAVSITPGQRHVTGTDGEGRLHVVVSLDGASWYWFAIDDPLPRGVSVRSVAATGWDVERFDAFLAGSDGALYHRSCAREWKPWRRAALPYDKPPAAFAATSWGPHRIDLFSADLGRSLFQRTHQ